VVHVRRLAMLLWLSSLLAPTALSHRGDQQRGYEVALSAIGGLLAFPAVAIALPLVLLSLATNALFIVEGVRLARPGDRALSLRHAIFLLCALLLNVGVVWFHASTPSGLVNLLALLQFPGVYLWLLGFALLATSAVYEQRVFFTGLSSRLALVSLVAAAVVAAVFGIMLLVHR